MKKDLVTFGLLGLILISIMSAVYYLDQINRNLEQINQRRDKISKQLDQKQSNKCFFTEEKERKHKRIGKEVEDCFMFTLYEKTLPEGLLITVKLKSNFSSINQDILNTLSKGAVDSIKRLYSNNYILEGNEQESYSSGRFLSPKGEPLEDCKAYLLYPKAIKN